MQKIRINKLYADINYSLIDEKYHIINVITSDKDARLQSLEEFIDNGAVIS